MLPVLTLTLGFGAVLGVSAAAQFNVKATVPTGSQPATPLTVSQNVLTLKKSTKSSKSSAYLRGIRAKYNTDAASSANATAIDNLDGVEYTTTIEWAETPFQVIVDTGSSDTWLVQEGFTCVTDEGEEQSESECGFGTPFSGTFEDGAIANENFLIEYGDGEFALGTLGYEDVTVAGITVPNQEVALVNEAYWDGDDVTSGLMGLAYPLLTSAYEGTDPNDDTTQEEYNPIFTTMYTGGLVPALFSLAQERNSDAGYLAFGGLPPVTYTGSFTSTPILMIEIYDEPAMATQYSFYTIIPTGFVYERSTATSGKVSNDFSNLFTGQAAAASSSTPMIVDSGTTLLYLPTSMVEDVMALYKPAATYLEEYGAYFAECTAEVPEFGVTISNTTFYINAADMLMQDQTDDTGRYCLTGPQDGGEGPYILGDTFLNNVVAVFDVGASEMQFAVHDY